MGRLDLRKQNKNLSRGDTNTSTTIITRTLSQELLLSMDRTKAAVIHYPEKVDKVAKAEDMATAEAIAAVALLQVITMAEAKIKLNPNSQALTFNTHEISKTCTADKSSSRDLIHA